MDPGRRRSEAPLTGDPPNPVNPPSGCRFRTRCGFAEDICAATVPPLAALGNGHFAACLMVDDDRHSGCRTKAAPAERDPLARLAGLVRGDVM
jgi:peptide/nickel transport system ATP-binding protein